MILGIDSSGKTASVALIDQGVVLAEYQTNIGLTHSQTLLPMVAEIFSRTGHTADELEAIAVSSGPGSFTGLRIGAATAKGLALPYNIPLIEVSTLAGLAANTTDLFNDVSNCSAAETTVYVHPIMDARRQQVYTAAYHNNRLIGEEEAIGIDELIRRLNQEDSNIHHLFLGDAVPVYKDYLVKNLTVPFRFAGPQNMLQRASSIALLGERELALGNTVSSADFRLSYIRKPQAEREKEAAGLREFDITHDAPELLKKHNTEDRLQAQNYAIGDHNDNGYEDNTVPENL